jgi:cupin fold WbuC family metalloprotein
VKQIDQSVLDALTTQAKESPRKRAHHNLHTRLDDPVQRLCVAIEPETYIRPHRHADPATSEVFLLLRGTATLLFFDDAGTVTERAVLSAKGPVFAAEIPPKTWHTIASLESGAIFFEVKQGPYAQPKDANSADWAPEEGAPAVARFVEWYGHAKVGDVPPEK